MLTVQHLNVAYGVLVLYYGDGGFMEVIRGRSVGDEDVEAAQEVQFEAPAFFLVNVILVMHVCTRVERSEVYIDSCGNQSCV